MTGGTLHSASRDRHIVIAPPNAIRDVLAKHVKQRTLVALLVSQKRNPAELETVVQALLDHGCEFFVCFGAGSEALHDRIDDLVVDRAEVTPDSLNVVTTWHEDETPAEVAEFFVNVAAAKEGSLMVAALDESETELARALAQQASV